jgi:hypothetical protein
MDPFHWYENHAMVGTRSIIAQGLLLSIPFWRPGNRTEGGISQLANTKLPRWPMRQSGSWVTLMYEQH